MSLVDGDGEDAKVIGVGGEPNIEEITLEINRGYIIGMDGVMVNKGDVEV